MNTESDDSHRAEESPDCHECGANDGTHYPQCLSADAIHRRARAAAIGRLTTTVTSASKPRNPRVLIESPVFTRADGTRCSPAEVERNMRYLRRAALDSLRRDEDPYASCLIYPQVLDDATPEERKRGIEAGLNRGEAAAKVAFYADHGSSDGVRQGLDRHRERGVDVEQRLIGAEAELGAETTQAERVDDLSPLELAAEEADGDASWTDLVSTLSVARMPLEMIKFVAMCKNTKVIALIAEIRLLRHDVEMLRAIIAARREPE